jgi:hypothetical protein
MEEIDRLRRSHFGDIPEATAADISAVLTRIGQQTLALLFRHSRKPIESEMTTAAAVFYHRFFLRESPVVFHPRAVLIACIHLSTKTEEFHAISLSDLVSSLPDAEGLKVQIPKIEMRLLSAIDFDLIVEQPWQVALFWADELKHVSDMYLRVYDVTCELLRVWQWTDAISTFSFPKLATAAIVKACVLVDSQMGSPEDVGDTLHSHMFRIVGEKLPSIDVNSLVNEVESVVNRFGKFDRILKDPEIEATPGYQAIIRGMQEGGS